MYRWDDEHHTSFTGNIEINGEICPCTFAIDSKGKAKEIWDKREELEASGEIEEYSTSCFHEEQMILIKNKVDKHFDKIINMGYILSEDNYIPISDTVIGMLSASVFTESNAQIYDATDVLITLSPKESKDVLKKILSARNRINQDYSEFMAFIKDCDPELRDMYSFMDTVLMKYYVGLK